jgi:hypothetical protein
MKRVADVKKDEELKAASWEAAQGALAGATRVCSPLIGNRTQLDICVATKKLGSRSDISRAVIYRLFHFEFACSTAYGSLTSGDFIQLPSVRRRTFTLPSTEI